MKCHVAAIITGLFGFVGWLWVHKWLCHIPQVLKCEVEEWGGGVGVGKEIEITSYLCYIISNAVTQALEYLLWASVSLELSVPIMTPEYLPWIVTLYCAVCRCYYDSQLPMQAEV